jgi:hypothetical protein
LIPLACSQEWYSLFLLGLSLIKGFFSRFAE